jgi:hypothetical protein
MKETLKLLAIYIGIIIIFVVYSCTKVDIPEPVINLGTQSTSTAITHLSTAITSGKVDVTMSVTPGAKYSLQLIDLKGDVKYATGFTADNNVVIKNLDYSDVNSGDYTIVLIDISGKEYKRSLTIKK